MPSTEPDVDTDEVLIRRVARTTLIAVLAFLVGAAVLTMGAVATGQLNMSDITHRLPRPVAAWFVENPDESARLTCDQLDETSPNAVEAYARQHGVEVVYVPEGVEVGPLERVDYLHWRNRLVATIAADPGRVPGPDSRVSGMCLG